VDAIYGDDRTENNRTNFRLHHRGAGNTTGCIAVQSDEDWKSIKDMIESYNGGKAKAFSKSINPMSPILEEVKSFGWIEVVDPE